MTFFQIEHAVYDMFSAPWLGGIAITATYALVVYFFSNKLKHDDLALTRFERIWGGLLIALFLVKHVQLLAIGDWSMTENMELHLCGMSRLLSILLLAFAVRWAFFPLFFWGIVGGFHSLLTPELTGGDSTFMYIEYYIIHGGIIIIPLYFVFVRQRMIGQWTWAKILALNVAMMLPVYAINRLIDANYMFLVDPPKVESILIQGPWPYYLIGFVGAGLLHYLLLTGLFWKRIKANDGMPK